MNVLAIWTTNAGCTCQACKNGNQLCHAAVGDGDGDGEKTVTISENQYRQLRDMAAWGRDYFDRDYVSFSQPIEWGDVFAEDRVA